MSLNNSAKANIIGVVKARFAAEEEYPRLGNAAAFEKMRIAQKNYSNLYYNCSNEEQTFLINTFHEERKKCP